MANITKKLFYQNYFIRIILTKQIKFVPQKALSCTKDLITEVWYTRRQLYVPKALFKALGTAERLLVYQSL